MGGEWEKEKEERSKERNRVRRPGTFNKILMSIRIF